MTDVTDLKNRAAITPGYFQIKDALTNQILISTHVNNPQNKTFGQVIDNLVNDAGFAGFYVNIGNSSSDARKVTYFVEGAGYNDQVAQVLNQATQHTTLNGLTVTMPSIQKPKGNDIDSIEEFINAKLAAQDAIQQSRILEERFNSLSRELQIQKESTEREMKLREDYNRKMLELERIRLEEERAKVEEEREKFSAFHELGKGVLAGLFDLGKSYLNKPSNLSGAGNGEPTKEEPPKPKKPSFSVQIVNQNGEGGQELPKTTAKTEAKNGADPLAFAGLSDYERKLIERLRAEEVPELAADEILEFLDSAEQEEPQEAEVVK